VGNAGAGVLIDGQGGNTIGGTAAGAGNTISGNAGDGISLDHAADNDIQGNRIGTTSDGTNLRPNLKTGIDIVSSPSNAIGGSAPGAGNLVSRNLSTGIRLENNTSNNNVVEGNLVGTNAAGTLALPNENGIAAEGDTIRSAARVPARATSSRATSGRESRSATERIPPSRATSWERV
jgi:parallel beta-helix repeat protein